MTPEQRRQAEDILAHFEISVRPYSTYNFGKSKDSECLSIIGPAAMYGSFFRKLRQLIPSGLVVFTSVDSESEQIIIGAGETQFDIIRLARTNAPDVGLTTEDIIQKLQQYDAEVGIDIYFAKTNSIQFNLLNLPKDIPAFARDVFEFCPEPITYLGATVEFLELQIEKQKYVPLTWNFEAGCESEFKEKKPRKNKSKIVVPKPTELPIMSPEQRQQALKILQEITGLPIRPYSTFEFGRQQDPQCLSVIQTPESGDFLGQVREALPAGLIAFRGTNNEELVVGAGESQFDIIHLARTDAMNYGLDAEQIIEKLKEYDAQVGIEINFAETDSIEFNIIKSPSDAESFAQDIYEFCPDSVDQGVGTLDALQMQIDMFGCVQLWWD